MSSFLERLFAWFWNWIVSKPAHPTNPRALSLGNLVIDGEVTDSRLVLAELKRAEHIAILGRTGTGKSTLLKQIAGQDIDCDRGFLCIDHHGDTTPTILQLLAQKEQATGQDL